MPWHEAESRTDVLTAQAQEGPEDAGTTPEHPQQLQSPRSKITENSASAAKV